MAISLVSSVEEDFDAGGWSATGGTTTAINTTGANLIVLALGWYVGSATATVSDSKGNTWIALTDVSGGFSKHQIYYAKNATVGTGHTFTISMSTSAWPGAFVYAISGADTTAPFDVQNSFANVLSSGPISIAVTPTINGSFIVTGLRTGNATTSTVSIDLSFILTKNTGGAAAYIIQTTAATINPTWNYSGGNQGAAITIASFKPSIVTPPTSNERTQLSVGLG